MSDSKTELPSDVLKRMLLKYVNNSDLSDLTKMAARKGIDAIFNDKHVNGINEYIAKNKHEIDELLTATVSMVSNTRARMQSANIPSAVQQLASMADSTNKSNSSNAGIKKGGRSRPKSKTKRTKRTTKKSKSKK